MSTQSITKYFKRTLPANSYSNTNPLVVEFAGGLGNQLFQYAFAQYLQRETQRPLLFDTTAVQRDVKRTLLIQSFAIDDSNFITNRRTLFSILGCRINTSLSRLEKLINIVLPYVDPRKSNKFLLIDDDIESKPILTEDTTVQEYAKHIINTIHKHSHIPVYVRGYWQYAFFAQEMFSLLAEHFRVKHKLSKTVLDLAEMLTKHVNNKPHTQDLSLLEHASNSSCSIHIRRGDYLEFDVESMFPKLSMDYYTHAIQSIADAYPKTHFYIFSDDPQWCQEYFSITKKHTIVSGNISKTAIDDLVLMNCCDHHILANSSFSWWGGGLNNILEIRKDPPNDIAKSVNFTFAPSVWFSDSIKNAHIRLSTWKT